MFEFVIQRQARTAGSSPPLQKPGWDQLWGFLEICLDPELFPQNVYVQIKSQEVKAQ